MFHSGGRLTNTSRRRDFSKVPADRFLHPRLGHSHKVNLLTDLEFRVWVQYQLSADDFGVMRRSAVTVQADNDHLSTRPKRVIERCLDAIVTRGLLLPFSHQGRHYVCQFDWQRFQKVEYPRPTFEPKPPEDVLATCESKTQELFTKHPGGSPKRSPNISQTFGETSEAGSQELPDYARGRPRETAKANGSGSLVSGSEKEPERKPDARSKRPMFTGQKLTVFEWMLDDCVKTLGNYLPDFDLHEWFFQLDKQAFDANLVIPRRDNGEWLVSQLVSEAQRRGIPLVVATANPANKRISGLVAGGQAFLNRSQK